MLAGHARSAYRELFAQPVYRARIALLVVLWFLGYVTVYAFSAGFTSILTSLDYKPPEAGVIVAVGAFGFLACALFAALFAERLERKLWLPISAVLTLAGGVLVAEAGSGRTVAFLGAAVIFFGFNLWVPMSYARSAENFPTRARTTGFGIVDGVGHLGGGIGVLLIAPLIPKMSVLAEMMLIGAFLVGAALIGQFGINTRDRSFDELAP
jgi:putative MFS transporter